MSTILLLPSRTAVLRLDLQDGAALPDLTAEESQSVDPVEVDPQNPYMSGGKLDHEAGDAGSRPRALASSALLVLQPVT